MKRIAITTDTNSGMIPNETDEQGIFVLPMPFVIDGTSLLESVELSRENFYDKLISDANISTSQPSVTEVSEFWQDILKNYDEIVHIPTSSVLSNSCSTAMAIAKQDEFAGKVFVVDNRRISIALKSSVLDAAKLREQEKSSEEIKAYLENTASDYSIYLSIENMKYLKKGGRVSPAVAAIGSMLKLRPVLHLGGDKLEKFAIPRTLLKAKETIINAIHKDLTTHFKDALANGEMKLCMAYANNPDDAKTFQAEVEKRFPNVCVLCNDPISLSIACHTGPATIALGCIRVVK